MKLNDQKIAFWTWLGWQPCNNEEGWRRGTDYVETDADLPDPLDLNVMWNAELNLIPDKWNGYISILHRVVAECVSKNMILDNPLVGFAAHATAKQRLEAILLLNGLWTE